MAESSLVAGLNPPQKEAVQYISSPLLVLAGAGSGKTRVITNKIAWLVKERNMLAEHIAAVTFTNKAAKEMKERAASLLSKSEAKGLQVSTFHTLGLRILRIDMEAAGLRKGFSIVDGSDALLVILEMMRQNDTVDTTVGEDVQRQISSWKNLGLTPEQVMRLDSLNPLQQLAARVYPEYNAYLRACNTVDLDDLILMPRILFEENPEVLLAWRERIRYLLVDEYQDTNAAQYELVKLLVGEKGRLTVVGDDDQSIYAWRGAQPENLAKLQDDFPSLKLVKLEQNYRSVGRVLKLANSVISNNPRNFDKSLWTAVGYGDPVKVMGAKHEEQEAERVISALLHHQFTKRTKYGQYAILYRSNHQARVLEKKLREMRIDYRLSGGQSFFDRSEVRDMMAYLRLISNLDDDNAFLRAVNRPKRGIGAATLSKLGELAHEYNESLFRAINRINLAVRVGDRAAALLKSFYNEIIDIHEYSQKGSAAKSLDMLMQYIDYETWLLDISANPTQAQQKISLVNDVINWIKNWKPDEHGEPKSLAEIVADMMLVNMLDKSEDEFNENQVSLMTIHTSKGLEFDHVYIVGLEEGILPHRQSFDEVGIEEERRLFYVGITRARQSLTLSYAHTRKRQGEVEETEISRFMNELPEEDLVISSTEQANKKVDLKYAKSQFAGLRASLQ